jgi:FAD-linked oxidoreductase
MIRRRLLLQMLAAGAAGASLPAATALAAPAGRKIPWRNWSGIQQCLPSARLAPASVAELQEQIVAASGTVRPVGAGHSFTALVPTDDTLVSLARMGGIVGHDKDNLQATFGGGTRLSDMGAPLHELGQAMINMPDIDEQVLAGALATATHGTGAGVGALHTFVTRLKMVTADGSLLECSPAHNSDIFQAALVSLGSLGVVTDITVQNTTPYKSRRESWFLPWEELLEQADDLADKHRNFEFFYIPFSNHCLLDSHDITEEENFSTPRHDQNDATNDLKMIRDYLGWSPAMREFVLSKMPLFLEPEVSVEASWLNYANERNVRFNELEFHLPRELALKALVEVRQALEDQHHDVFFPIEFRYIKQDDAWLSPFYERDTCSIAVHRYFEEDYKPYFKTIEPILRKYHGRPHWGKLHNLQAADFSGLYPRWQDFLEVRQQLDPNGKFLNQHLRDVFGAG